MTVQKLLRQNSKSERAHEAQLSVYAKILNFVEKDFELSLIKIKQDEFFYSAVKYELCCTQLRIILNFEAVLKISERTWS